MKLMFPWTQEWERNVTWLQKSWMKASIKITSSHTSWLTSTVLGWSSGKWLGAVLQEVNFEIFCIKSTRSFPHSSNGSCGNNVMNLSSGLYSLKAVVIVWHIFVAHPGFSFTLLYVSLCIFTCIFLPSYISLCFFVAQSRRLEKAKFSIWYQNQRHYKELS